MKLNLSSKEAQDIVDLIDERLDHSQDPETGERRRQLGRLQALRDRIVGSPAPRRRRIP